MARIIFGIDKADKAEVYKNGRKIILSRQSMRSTMGALIPEDRKELGLVYPCPCKTIWYYRA